jgi:hypothetical protein
MLENETEISKKLQECLCSSCQPLKKSTPPKCKAYLKLFFWHLHGGSDEKNKNLQSGYSILQSRFKPGTSEI